MGKMLRFFIMGNIFLILFFISCSKEEEKIKPFELNKNIEFNLDNIIEKNSEIKTSDKLFYNFLDKKDKIIYKVNSLQLFTSKYSQILFTISFDINMKRIDKLDYKIYFTNFKLKHKLYYGYFNFESVEKKYNLLINSIYFNMSIDKLGRKSFSIERKISLNKKFKPMIGFIYNILNSVFIEIPENTLINNNFIFNDIKYELTTEYEENGSLKLKKNIKKRKIKSERKSNFVILKSDINNNKLRVLFSLKDGLPKKINLLFEDKDKLEFENKEYEYSIKNYFFIERK